jgi:peptidyl-prolyl cis-trans isomerase B (cyclophilin B)
MAAAVATTMLMLTGCGSDAEKSESKESAKQSGNTIVLTLHTDQAPITCENFEKLVNEGFYNGLTFHRVVDNFMAQGGDPEGTGMGGSKETIKGEFKNNGVNNELSHQRGVVSMARSSDPDSASSQFFICYGDCSFLDGDYAAFANVTEGMELVDDFTKVKRSANSMGEIAIPDTPIKMEKVEMIEPDESGSPRVKITMNNFLG